MLGGIKIGPGSSRRDIEKKLEDLEKQKDNGFITLEEYDTLRIRLERKLGNREVVSELQERKGFTPSNITEKKAIKDELYDDFVDKYAKKANIDAQKEATNSISGRTKRLFLLVFVLVAFTVGIAAGMAALNVEQSQAPINVTVSDSAFIDNATIAANNQIQNNTNITIVKSNYKPTKKVYSSKNTTKTTTSTNSTKSSSSSSDKKDSSTTSSKNNEKTTKSTSSSQSSTKKNSNSHE